MTNILEKLKLSKTILDSSYVKITKTSYLTTYFFLNFKILNFTFHQLEINFLRRVLKEMDLEEVPIIRSKCIMGLMDKRINVRKIQLRIWIN